MLYHIACGLGVITYQTVAGLLMSRQDETELLDKTRSSERAGFTHP